MTIHIIAPSFTPDMVSCHTLCSMLNGSAQTDGFTDQKGLWPLKEKGIWHLTIEPENNVKEQFS